MPKFEFVGQTSQDANHIAANTSRLLNCYRVPVMGQSRYVVRAALGETSYVDTGHIFARDIVTLGDDLYISTGGNLVKISASGGQSTVGSVVNGESNLSTNNGTVTVAGSGSYHTWDGTTLSSPTTLFDAGSCCFLNQRTIISEYEGRGFQWSDLVDPTTFQSSSFATKEAKDDNILRCIANGGRLYLFGERSIEIWGETGLSGAGAFQRLPGAVIEQGLHSYGLAAPMDHGIFFVGDDGIAYIMAGGNHVAVSSRSMEAAIADGTPTRAFYYEDAGQKFCVVRFADRPAWVFDMATKEWHERGRGSDFRAWDVVATTERNGIWYTATDAGEVNFLARSSADPSEPLYRRMVSNTLYLDGQRRRLAELELYPNSGNHGMTTTDTRLALLTTSGNVRVTDSAGNYIGTYVTGSWARDPMCTLRISTDDGHHWSKERPQSIGALGRYDKRTLWRSLGSGRQFTAEVTCAEPADIEFQSDCRVRVA